MLNNTLGILVTILLLFSACKDEEPSISSTKELLNFSILKSDNQGKVANDVEASIQGSVITLPLDKYDDLKSLIAVFEYNGKSITIDGVEQESGVTSNDYSQPLVFTVEAEDGSKQQYTVEIALKDTGVLSAFRFLKKNIPWNIPAEKLFTLIHVFDQALNVVLILCYDIKLLNETVGEHGSHGKVLGQLGF